jgi:hypothetical protein
MNHIEIGWEGRDWVVLVQNKDSNDKEFSHSIKGRNFFISREVVTFSRKSLLHGVTPNFLSELD